jgi:hypothetical protein
MYIKALEQEVLRLKEIFGNTAKERDAYADENRRLKELLAANGIAFDMISPRGLPSSYGGSSSGSISGSYAPGSAGFSPTPGAGVHGQRTPVSQQNLAQLPRGGLDYDQIGIDFVLTYGENPQYERTPYLSPPPGQ